MAVLGVSFPVICVLLLFIAREEVLYCILSTCLSRSSIMCNTIARVLKEQGTIYIDISNVS